MLKTGKLTPGAIFRVNHGVAAPGNVESAAPPSPSAPSFTNEVVPDPTIGTSIPRVSGRTIIRAPGEAPISIDGTATIVISSHPFTINNNITHNHYPPTSSTLFGADLTLTSSTEAIAPASARNTGNQTPASNNVMDAPASSSEVVPAGTTNGFHHH